MKNRSFVEPSSLLPPRVAETGSSTAAPLSPPSEHGDVVRLDVGRGPLLTGLLRSMRPRQWVKNLLVLAAPASAGVLTSPPRLLTALTAVGVFCLVASSTYLVNDVLDAEADRRHPRKRLRPIAAAVVSVRLALATAALLAVVGVATAVATLDMRFVAILLAYAGTTLAYSVWLKHVAILDLVVIALGFVLRAVGGAVVTNVHASDWFLLVVSFGALLMAGGKRFGEHDAVDVRRDARPVLAAYSSAFLRQVVTVAAAAAVVCYVLWAMAPGSPLSNEWRMASVAPFVVAILRYVMLVDVGDGQTPEDAILGDRMLQVSGLVWAILFGLAVYGG
ncbi:MAG: decaprenyl-phosphate phosphoribosyltransferase [Nitriliruptorales bacterium]